MTNKIQKISHNPYWIVYYFILISGLHRMISDTLYLRLQYRCTFSKRLNLKDPKSYNEKIQWLKLFDRNPLYKRLADKFEVKKYVAEKVGDQYIIPTLGVWDSFNDIEFRDLPEQFVLKCTHDTGSTIICRKNLDFDFSKAKKNLNRALKRDSFLPGREWVYKGIKPRIIAEKYMTDGKNSGLTDYKIFCFNGVPKCLFIATDRHLGDKYVKFDFFDIDFNPLNIIQLHEQSSKETKKPVSFDEMIRLAKTLSSGIPHVRIDLYEINGKPYFGEFTFYHHGGTIPFKTEQWDEILGSWLELPAKTQVQNQHVIC